MYDITIKCCANFNNNVLITITSIMWHLAYLCVN